MCYSADKINDNHIMIQNDFSVVHTPTLLDLYVFMSEMSRKEATIEQLERVEGDVTRPNPSKKVCSVHADRELELYCETCGELICSYCTLQGQKHLSHEYNLITSCYEKYKREMTPSLGKQLTTVKKALAHFDEHCGEISDQQAATEADIHRTTQQLHEIIDVRETKLISQLHQRTQEKLKGLAVQRDKLETIMAKLSSCLESLETSSQEEVMTTIIKQVKELTATLQPDVLKPNTEADIEFIASTDVTAMCQNYGRIGVPGSPDPSQCHATGKGLEVAVVGEESTAIVQASDFKGEPCKALFQCELISELTGAILRGNVKRREIKGQYEISYCPTTKGRHQLSVKVEDQHIRGSPFFLCIKSTVMHLDFPFKTFDQINQPYGIVLNARGEMVVTERDRHCVTVLSPSGEKPLSFGTQGSGEGQFKCPNDVAVDSNGNILVTDGGNHRIQKFTARGEFIVAVSTDINKPSIPMCIAYNTYNDKIYMTDFSNHCIQVFNSDLTFSSTIGGKAGERTV